MPSAKEAYEIALSSVGEECTTHFLDAVNNAIVRCATQGDTCCVIEKNHGGVLTGLTPEVVVDKCMRKLTEEGFKVDVFRDTAYRRISRMIISWEP